MRSLLFDIPALLRIGTQSRPRPNKPTRDIFYALPKCLAALVLILLIPVRTAFAAQETVVLVHGIANLPLSMSYLERSLEKRGYRVVNLGYPSTRVPIEEAARRVLDALREQTAGDSRVHLVGHSMGNIVLRKALERGLPNLGRMVMIAPPNRGSFAAEALHDLDIYLWVLGPAGQQLSAGNQDFFDALPTPPCPFGIIAGGKGDGRGFNPILPGDDDGTVRVEETRLQGASGFVLVNNTHTLLLFDAETAEYTSRFLASGRFDDGPGDGLRSR